MNHRSWMVRVLLCVLPLFVLAACGSSSSQDTFPLDGGDGGSASRGNPHHEGGSGQKDGTVGTMDAPRLTNKDTGSNIGTLSVSPATATVAVTSASLPSQTFTAEVDMGGTKHSVEASWTLSSFSLGSIDAGGTFTPNGTVAGTVEVTATYGVLTATAKLAVTVNLTSNLATVTLPDGTVISEDSTAITPADMTALQGTPVAPPDGGSPSSFVYPYDKTVFPLGLLAPVVQFSAGSVPPTDFKVSLSTTGFEWEGFGHVGNPAALQAAIPQTAWDGALESAATHTPTTNVKLSIVTATAGVAYGPSEVTLIVANGKLTGVIYYESYSTDPIDAGSDATDFGLWAVKPGQTQPPSHIEPGCVICHGVSAAGNTLTNGTDDPTVGDLTGVFRVEADGGYTHLATAPSVLFYLPPAGVSGDSRGLGWGTVSPDGKVILRGINDFWGGESLLAWATPSEPLMEAGTLQPLSTEMNVTGDFNMFVPQYSPDGKHLVYVSATNAPDAGPPGTPSQSIGMLDIASQTADGGGDAGFGAVALSNPRLLYDSTSVSADAGGAGTLTKVPTFLPDSQTIVFEETMGGQTTAMTAGFNGMLPDYTGVDGELAVLQKTASGAYVRTAMANANASVDPNGPTHNFEPKPLPVSVGGYYWVVFASLRQDAYPSLSGPKKLWVTAISPTTAAGNDPSNPPFTLINQAIVAPQQSQRAYWALSPCTGTGSSCQTSTDCCNGSCIPESADASSSLVCRVATSMTCVPLGGRCAAGQSQDCCNSADGVTCIGTLNGYGTCGSAGAPP